MLIIKNKAILYSFKNSPLPRCQYVCHFRLNHCVKSPDLDLKKVYLLFKMFLL